MFNRVLVLGPHTDDGEFGCGATIHKFIQEGKEVFYVAFSAAEESVPADLPRGILRTEIKEAAVVLGIKPGNLFTLKYPVRKFPTHRQNILEDMVQFNKDIKPDLVLLPASSDTHQDHEVVHNEGFRVFKRTAVIGYELPWNNLTFTANMFITLDKTHVGKKVEALKRYKSQNRRAYFDPEIIWSLARMRGSQIAVKYAEVFEVIRWVV